MTDMQKDGWLFGWAYCGPMIATACNVGFGLIDDGQSITVPTLAPLDVVIDASGQEMIVESVEGDEVACKWTRPSGLIVRGKFARSTLTPKA